MAVDNQGDDIVVGNVYVVCGEALDVTASGVLIRIGTSKMLVDAADVLPVATAAASGDGLPLDGSAAMTGDLTVGANAAGDRTITVHSGTDSVNVSLTTESDTAPIGLFANGADLNLTSTGDINLIPTGDNINFGAAAAGDLTITAFSGTSGDHFTLTTASNVVTLSAVGTGNDFIVGAANNIHLRPTGGSVSVGVAGGGTRSITINSATSGDHLYIASTTNVGYLQMYGGSLLLEGVSGFLQLKSSTGSIRVGDDAGVDITQTWYSSVAGDKATLTTATNLVTLSGVGTGVVLSLAAADNIKLVPAGSANAMFETSGAASWFGIDSVLAASVYFYSLTPGVNFRITAEQCTATGTNFHLGSTSGSVIFRPNGNSTDYLVCASNGTWIQNDAASGQPTLHLTGNDVDEPFIDYIGTTEAGVTKSLSSYATPGAVQGHVRVAINGTDYWMPYYAAPSA